MLKVWVNNKFKGFYPVGTAAVIVSATKKKAVKYLDAKLKELHLEKSNAEDMLELAMVEGNALILNDGNY